MILIFTLLVILGSVSVIVYPLFKTRIQKYEIPGNDQLDSSLEDICLTALSDLEDDYALGRLSESDYIQQKIILQRNYLNLQRKEVQN